MSPLDRIEPPIERRAALLDVLDAVVAKDRGPPGFAGKVCVGVLDATGATYWACTFGASASAGFVEDVPEDADATLLLGAADADIMVNEGRFPEDPTLARIKGDRWFLRRFTKRYIRRALTVTVPAALPNEPRRRRTRR